MLDSLKVLQRPVNNGFTYKYNSIETIPYDVDVFPAASRSLKLDCLYEGSQTVYRSRLPDRHPVAPIWKIPTENVQPRAAGSTCAAAVIPDV